VKLGRRSDDGAAEAGAVRHQPAQVHHVVQELELLVGLVGPHVRAKLLLLGEHQRARLALELFERVRLFVTRQFGFGREALRARRARVRLLARVRHLVAGEIVLADELGGAVGAGMLLGVAVRPLVTHQLVRARERLLTNLALEGLHTRVDRFVPEELAAPEEGLPAVAAGVRPNSQVRQLVGLHVAFVGELFIAHFARVRLAVLRGLLDG